MATSNTRTTPTSPLKTGQVDGQAGVDEPVEVGCTLGRQVEHPERERPGVSSATQYVGMLGSTWRA